MNSSTVPAEAAAVLRQWLGEEWAAEPLAGDASVRAYYRVALPDRTYVLAYYPPEVREQLRRFLDAYHAVAPHGTIPEVRESCEFAVLQRDVGDRSLFDLLHDDPVEGVRLYRAAIDLLVAFQRAPGREINPPFTSGFFLAELDMTREYYVEKLMGVRAAVADRLEPVFRRLADNVSQHPYILCHRDFHGQNIHIQNATLYLLDYQDLRLGPDTYDLASLLRDRGVARLIGADTELELIEYYAARSGRTDGLRRRYFETLLQRSIKILGTFARQPIARGRLHYLEFIPPTLESVYRCLEELPEFAIISDLLPMDFSMPEARRRVEAVKES
ncbi:MAG TPA: phosphotransferase [Thermoanaerobaculia bacterium]|nr:phosphotransferase [Thermoanaerobaculia bacterium]